jgi:DAK2 domain fusion protein YloV
MVRRACDGQGLLAAFRAGVANVEEHVDELNGLNVYPVPDGDTGSNMAATVRAALDEAEAVADQPAGRIAAAISFGALMGARGNSGVITSQVFRGMAEALGDKRRFNGLDLANALDLGARAAYGAVAKPVEGTILTVVREAAAAGVAAAERNNDIETVLTAIVDAAEKAVAKTPSLLPILREAGVVDAGGQGLYRLFQGGLRHLVGQTSPTTERRAPAARASTLVAHADDGFGYETMFLVQAAANGRLDPDAVRRHLETIGESVLVAGDPLALKVHVHSEHPDEVIGYGLTLGALSRISVENLDNQARDIRETRAAAFTREAVVDPAPVAAGSAGTVTPSSNGRLPLAVIAVAAGDGLAAIFRDFGVASVVRGGQSANPSTGELLEAVKGLDAREILLLANNPNVVLAARQVASMADRPVAVVPTRNAAEGFAALLALDPVADATTNATAMTEAGRSVQSLVVTEAVRDATIGRRKVKRGETIVLDPDDGLVASGGDRDRAVLGAVAKLTPGFELLTIYYGDGADLAETERLAKRIGAAVPGAEVEVVRGGQPHHRYLIAAE